MGMVNAQEGGCLTAVNGQYPYTTYIPSCDGIPEGVTTTGWSGEYSKIQLTAGMDYTFSSSISTDLITISDEAGTEVILFGFGSVDYTPDADEVIRFYTHVNADCLDDQEDRARIMFCGEAQDEPEYGCLQTYDAGSFAHSSSIGVDYDNFTANDFFVPQGVEAYQLNSVTALIYAMAGSNTDFTVFDVKVWEDDEGKPGAMIESFDELTASNVSEHSEIFVGYRTFWVTLDLDGLELEIDENEDKRYWITVVAHSLNHFDLFWVAYPYTDGWNTKPVMESSDGGQTWTLVTQYGTGDYYDSYMTIDADCEESMSVADLTAVDFNYYPNPARDFLHIEAKKEIRSISVFNTAGQAVVQTSKLNDGKVNISHLAAGVYVFRVVLEDGKVETFKVVKR